MSFIMSVLKCEDCGAEMNIALGTFGYGMPEKCDCGSKKLKHYKDGWNYVSSKQ